MANLNNLSVSQISELRTEANNVHEHASDLQQLTNQMFTLVDDSTQYWQGKAQASFQSKFDSLRDDMQRIYDMVEKYSQDLEDIATQYENAENENNDQASSLSSDIELV